MVLIARSSPVANLGPWDEECALCINCSGEEVKDWITKVHNGIEVATTISNITNKCTCTLYNIGAT